MPDLRNAWQFLEESELVCSEQEIQAALARLAAQIDARLRDAYPVVLVVMGGAVVFAGQLLPRLRFPLDLDYVHATRYGAATSGGGIAWRVSPPEDVRGRIVLLLDDILDEGRTLAVVKEALLARGAAEVRIAAFARKERGEPPAIEADYVGVTVPNLFVFGFGMDVDGEFRNLPAIYALPAETGTP